MYRLQTQWVNCATQTSYISSLATWSDAAKDYYFNTGSLATHDELADHPFQLGDAPWVIRCHSFKFQEQRRYHSCTDYRTDLAISTAVTRVGRTSLDTEHNFYHEVDTGPKGGHKSLKLLCQMTSSIIVFSPDTGKPVSHGMDAHAQKCCAASLDIDKWLGEEPPSDAFQYTCKPRFSDLDGHGHVNNAILLSYLQDARHAALSSASSDFVKLENIDSMYVEFLNMVGLEDTLTIFVWEAPHPKGAERPRLCLHMNSACGSRTIVRARMDLAEKPEAGLLRLKPSSTVGTFRVAKQIRDTQQSGLELALQKIVERRRDRGLLRKLTVNQGIDFCSNDYLGFARSKDLTAQIEAEVARLSEAGSHVIGSTGSRLLSGNSAYSEALEDEIAAFHGAEAALIFNSGFDLNVGLFSSVPQPGDVVFYDELIHQSVREGLKLSRGSSQQFRHNDVEALREAIAKCQAESQESRPNIIVAVESVYSMDGHLAPLKEFCDVVKACGASLIVDEAHGTGVYGTEGRGLVSELGLEDQVFCRIHTFGKALGVHGAAMVGPRVLREYLINYAWSLVYSTSLPLHSLVAIRCAYAFLRKEARKRQEILEQLIRSFQSRLARLPVEMVLDSPSPIQGIIVPGNVECVQVANILRQRFDVLPIRSPTVPAGKERLRIILHAHNTEEEVNALMDSVEAAVQMIHAKPVKGVEAALTPRAVARL
eukprot:Skav209274  [mRNA]  locus=scaffold1552:289460:291586:+ [translate_table: standard]